MITTHKIHLHSSHQYTFFVNTYTRLVQITYNGDGKDYTIKYRDPNDYDAVYVIGNDASIDDARCIWRELRGIGYEPITGNE